MDRNERRGRTLAVAARRRALHLRVNHGGDAGELRCGCERRRVAFARGRPLSCHCTKRKRGAPRGPGGASPLHYEPLGGLDAFGRSVGTWREIALRAWHKSRERDRLYQDRHRWRVFAAEVRAGRLDADGPPPLCRDR